MTLSDRFDCYGRAVLVLTEGHHYVVDGETGCWVWQLYRSPHGYGRCNGGWAHRVMWVQAGHELNKGQPLHHRCHNPSCVNPDHLEPTEQSPHTRHHRWLHQAMTAEKLAEIRRLTAETTLTQREIAAHCGVSREAVVRIANEGTWTEGDVFEVRKPARICRWCGEPVPVDRRRHATFCCPEHRIKYHSRQITERRRAKRQEVAA